MSRFTSSALAVAVGLASSFAMAQSTNLLRDAFEQARPGDMRVPAAALERIRQRSTVERARLVEIDAMTLSAAGVTFDFNPFADVVLPLRHVRTDGPGGSEFTWQGRVDLEQGGSATMVVRGEQVTGIVRAGRDIYTIESVGSGLHAVTKLDPRRFPPDHPPQQDHDGVQLSGSAEPPLKRAAQREAGASTRPTTIDVIVAYTQRAVVESGNNVSALVDIAVAEANASYAASGVNVELRLVHKYQTNYKESSWNNDLKRFRVEGDRYMDEIHALRRTHKADVAVLVIHNPSACGLASAILADQRTAFAAVHWDCAAGYYSFAHEIGHLQGARHNPESDNGSTPYAWGHGYRFPAGGWRTIMAYDSSTCDGGTCTRVGCWSTPARTYPCTSSPAGGVPMGTAPLHDNARVLNDTDETVANFLGP